MASVLSLFHTSIDVGVNKCKYIVKFKYINHDFKLFHKARNVLIIQPPHSNSCVGKQLLPVNLVTM